MSKLNVLIAGSTGYIGVQLIKFTFGCLLSIKIKSNPVYPVAPITATLILL